MCSSGGKASAELGKTCPGRRSSPGVLSGSFFLSFLSLAVLSVAFASSSEWDQKLSGHLFRSAYRGIRTLWRSCQLA